MRPEHALTLLTLAVATDALVADDWPSDGRSGLSCPGPAELWLSTGSTFTNQDNGQVSFVFAANEASHLFTFASGTSQGDLIDAINLYQADLGLLAEQDPTNWSRIHLTTLKRGSQQFVCVQQLDPSDPGFLFESVESHQGNTALCAIGGTGLLGDLDCDAEVGPSDVAILLGAWGESEHIADLDSDGDVGPSDLTILLGGWGA